MSPSLIAKRCLAPFSLLAVLMAFWAVHAAAETGPITTLSWKHGLDRPRPLSGHAAGTSHGALVIVGGTDFPVSLFEGGQKVWYDTVHVLPPGDRTGQAAPPLDHPLGYAATVTVDDRMIVAGGSDDARHDAESYALQWVDRRLGRVRLPPLPAPVAMAGAAAIGQMVYVVGGHATPDARRALRSVWALDLVSTALRRPLSPTSTAAPGRMRPRRAACGWRACSRCWWAPWERRARS